MPWKECQVEDERLRRRIALNRVGCNRSLYGARRSSMSIFGRWRSLLSAVIDVLAKHDCHAVDIAYTKFSNSIRLICRLHCNHRTAID